MRLFALLLGISCILAAEEAAKDETVKEAAENEPVAVEKEPFDGIEIGLISGPKQCDIKVKRGDVVKVTFNVTTGHEEPGKGFETRYEKEPIEFVVGDEAVIRGFEVGIIDMCVDEVRFIQVPPKYHYDENNLGAIPVRATYYFVVKVLSIAEAQHDTEHMPDNIFKHVDTNRDEVLTIEEVKAYLNETGIPDVPGDNGLKQVVREIFREEDSDHNGMIDWEEFHGRKHEKDAYKDDYYVKHDL